MESEIGRILSWDSQHFGVRVARARDGGLDAASIQDLMAWCRASAVDCLYVLAEAADGTTTALLEDHGLHLADLRLTLQLVLDPQLARRPLAQTPAVRPYQPADLPALRALASVSHHDTRFYQDPHFPRPLCDALYATWIEKSCADPEQLVLVCEAAGRPAGYLTAALLSDGEGQIGLVAVDRDARRQGRGGLLIRESLDWFASRGVQRVTVVTQGRNLPALRAYQRCGFLICALQLWFHGWHCFEPRSVRT